MTELNGTPLDIRTGAVSGRLLQKGLELFTSKGYATTTVREIVEAAGVTKPVLYYYYGSKEGLYLELMNCTFATFAELLTSLAAHRGSARERLLHFCTNVLDSFIENLAVARLIYAIYFGPPQGAPHFPHEENFDRMVQHIGDIVREGMADGDLRRVDPVDATWAVVATLNLSMEEQLCHTPPRIDRRGLERILNLVIDGLTQGAVNK